MKPSGLSQRKPLHFWKHNFPQGVDRLFHERGTPGRVKGCSIGYSTGGMVRAVWGSGEAENPDTSAVVLAIWGSPAGLPWAAGFPAPPGINSAWGTAAWSSVVLHLNRYPKMFKCLLPILGDSAWSSANRILGTHLDVTCSSAFPQNRFCPIV